MNTAHNVQKQTDGILNAYAINGDGSGTVLAGDAISKTIKDDALAWVRLAAA